MEVMIERDFDFNSARSSLYPSPPSTPKGFGYYYCSAPSSPSRLTEFYRDFDDFSIESSPAKKGYAKLEEDFAFDVGVEVKNNTDDSTVASAEELFHGGMIKPMMNNNNNNNKATQRRVSVSSSSSSLASGAHQQRGKRVSPGRERGRERAPGGGLSSSSSRKAARSLSPLRVSQYPWEEEEEQTELLRNHQKQKQTAKPSGSSSSSSSSSSSTSATALTTSSSKGSGRKWRLKDFFLFRSASEGRASDKDPLKKYTALFRKVETPSNTSTSSNGVSASRRRSSRSSSGIGSAHELHYAANRAAKEDLKKKTFLPYKQGILGRLSFNPAAHALTNGFPFHK